MQSIKTVRTTTHNFLLFSHLSCEMSRPNPGGISVPGGSTIASVTNAASGVVGGGGGGGGGGGMVAAPPSPNVHIPGASGNPAAILNRNHRLVIASTPSQSLVPTNMVYAAPTEFARYPTYVRIGPCVFYCKLRRACPLTSSPLSSHSPSMCNLSDVISFFLSLSLSDLSNVNKRRTRVNC